MSRLRAVDDLFPRPRNHPLRHIPVGIKLRWGVPVLPVLPHKEGRLAIVAPEDLRAVAAAAGLAGRPVGVVQPAVVRSDGRERPRVAVERVAVARAPLRALLVVSQQV